MFLVRTLSTALPRSPIIGTIVRRNFHASTVKHAAKPVPEPRGENFFFFFFFRMQRMAFVQSFNTESFVFLCESFFFFLLRQIIWIMLPFFSG